MLGAKTSIQYLAISLDWTFVDKSIAAFFVMAGAIALLAPGTMAQILLSIGAGILAYFACLVALRGVGREEISLVVGSLRHVAHGGSRVRH